MQFANEIIIKSFENHRKIIYNGDCYSEQWVREAKQRGITIYSNGLEAISHITDAKNIELFEKSKILNKNELVIIRNTLTNEYVTNLLIELKTIKQIVLTDIIPSINEYKQCVCNIIDSQRKVNIDSETEIKLLNKLVEINKEIMFELSKIDTYIIKIESSLNESYQKINFKEIIITMEEIRGYLEEAEQIVDRKLWRFYTYDDFIYNY